MVTKQLDISGVLCGHLSPITIPSTNQHYKNNIFLECGSCSFTGLNSVLILMLVTRVLYIDSIYEKY